MMSAEYYAHGYRWPDPNEVEQCWCGFKGTRREIYQHVTAEGYLMCGHPILPHDQICGAYWAPSQGGECHLAKGHDKLPREHPGWYHCT